MLKKIDKQSISKLDIYLIIIETLIKIFRGLVYKPFFKKCTGLLFLGSKVRISHKHKITLGKNVKFESYSEIQGLSKQGLFFSDNVTIGRSVMIRPSSYYGVEVGEGFRIGKNSSIGPFGYIGCAGLIEIGNNVMIGPRVSLFAENHSFNKTDITIKEQGVTRKGIVIEDDCWIGSGVIILDGVTIGKGSIIGAGTLVAKNIPPYSKVVDKRDKLIIDRLEN